DGVGDVGYLQRRGQHVALADTHVVRIAFEPRLVLVELFPGRIGDGAVLFTANIETSPRAIAEAARIARQPFDTQSFEQESVALGEAAAEPEEVDIRRVGH